MGGFFRSVGPPAHGPAGRKFHYTTPLNICQEKNQKKFNNIDAEYLELAKEPEKNEARDAASRSEMTDEKRKNTRPDVDRTDVVFAGDDVYE